VLIQADKHLAHLYLTYASQQRLYCGLDAIAHDSCYLLNCSDHAAAALVQRLDMLIVHRDKEHGLSASSVSVYSFRLQVHLCCARSC
jgi:hypothetical protein